VQPGPAHSVAATRPAPSWQCFFPTKQPSPEAHPLLSNSSATGTVWVENRAWDQGTLQG